MGKHKKYKKLSARQRSNMIKNIVKALHILPEGNFYFVSNLICVLSIGHALSRLDKHLKEKNKGETNTWITKT